MGPGVSRHRQSGFTLTELLVALLLGWLLAGLALGTLAAQRRVLSKLAGRAEVLATARVARHVLGAEGRAQAPSDAVGVVAPDSVVLRAYRGQALVCASSSGDGPTVKVSQSGVRAPDAGRDSVLVVFPSAPPEARMLLHRGGAPEGCAGGTDLRWERWELSEPVDPGAVLVRYFRSVSYHVGGGALRLRSGRGGRQPLTPEVVDVTRSGFRIGDGGLYLTLTALGGEAEPSWVVHLSGRPPRG